MRGEKTKVWQMDAAHLDGTANAANPRDKTRVSLGLELSLGIPELPAKQQQVRGVLLGALGHFLRSVPQPVEAAVDVFNHLSARHELSLDVGGEVLLQQKPHTTQKGSSPQGTISLLDESHNKPWPPWRSCWS